MLTIEKKLNIAPAYDLSRLAPLERIVFFDIETTGLSAAKAGLYLIGALYWEQGSWRLCQWFADSLWDEEEMLSAFFGLLSRKKQLIRQQEGRSHSHSLFLLHFNGDTFDIPFLQRLAAQYRISWDLTGILSLDLFKKVKPYKELLGLENCRLKTVERFFGIQREDRFSGGELIYVYEEYLRLKNLDPASCEYTEQNLALCQRLQQTLLLHNEEDMTNLPMICGLLAYDSLFQGQYALSRAQLLKAPAGGGQVMDLSFSLYEGLPRELDLCDGPYCLCAGSGAEGRELNLAVSLREGELKYFFSDYKNYYYLPAEDYAVHRSVGAFVEKKARRAATARTCYQKKNGLFLPEPAAVFSPVFYEEYKGRDCYAAYSDSLLSEEERLKTYTGKVLESLSGKQRAEKKRARRDCF